MTKENAQLYLPLVQALAEGKTIETLANRKGCEDWEEVDDFNFFCSCSPGTYRIKPEPVMVPLGPEDVPPGSAIRQIGCKHWSIITHANAVLVEWPGVPSCEYDRLYSTYEIKRPGEDWMPCHKPARTNSKP